MYYLFPVVAYIICLSQSPQNGNCHKQCTWWFGYCILKFWNGKGGIEYIILRILKLENLQKHDFVSKIFLDMHIELLKQARKKQQIVFKYLVKLYMFFSKAFLLYV